MDKIKKYKMPNAEHFIKTKYIYDKKKDPVWVRLEREMRANKHKPYNQIVGDWLKFLKDFKLYQHKERKRTLKQLEKQRGPPWYCEFTSHQKETLKHLSSNIHQDLIEDIPIRIKQAVRDLGITTRFSQKILMEAMNLSIEDPGMFMWHLYKLYYKKSPSELLPNYTVNAQIMMSALINIDLEDCMRKLDEITALEPKATSIPEQTKHLSVIPKVKYGEYLERLTYPCWTPKPKARPREPRPMQLRINVRSQESYEKLCNNEDFLKARCEKYNRLKTVEKVCNYKFWEPPTLLRNVDPKMAPYIIKLKVYKEKPKLKCNALFENLQPQLGPVTYSCNKPTFLINGFSTIQTGFVPLHLGIVETEVGPLINIGGHWKFNPLGPAACDDKCDCIQRCEQKCMEYLNESKCRCKHLYDFRHEGNAKEKYFYPPTQNGPFWLDYAKIYQFDSKEDLIKKSVIEAQRSESSQDIKIQRSIQASDMPTDELLAALLGHLSNTPLLTPHLPKAHLVAKLQEFIRKKLKGKRSPEEDKKQFLKSQRAWLEIDHMDFRALAYHFKITEKQRKHMNITHKQIIMKLYRMSVNDFIMRNRLKQLQRSRILWHTMQNEAYCGPKFVDTYFAYMPGRLKDVLLLNPYNRMEATKPKGFTCPLPGINN